MFIVVVISCCCWQQSLVAYVILHLTIMRSYIYVWAKKYITIVCARKKVITNYLLQLFLKWITIWCNAHFSYFTHVHIEKSICASFLFFISCNIWTYVSLYFATIKSIHTKAIKCYLMCILLHTPFLNSNSIPLRLFALKANVWKKNT